MLFQHSSLWVGACLWHHPFMTTNTLNAYLAPAGFAHELEHELGDRVHAVYGDLVLAPPQDRPPLWRQNTWFDVQETDIASIGTAAQHLRGIQRNWVNYAFDFHRRSALVTEKLPHISAKPLVFGTQPPAAPLGGFSLVAPDRMIYAAHTESAFPNGVVTFVEDKEGPPSRAYLKLWEALTRINRYPSAGEHCLDLGACPGGWTWVLAQLSANVTAVDKAPLAPHVAAMPNVTWHQGSAFALAPTDLPPVDWLFSDIICYPPRLLRLVKNWIESGRVRNIICTIKFQGETDYQTISEFANIEGSDIFHLSNNKHELTFVRLAP